MSNQANIVHLYRIFEEFQELEMSIDEVEEISGLTREEIKKALPETRKTALMLGKFIPMAGPTNGHKYVLTDDPNMMRSGWADSNLLAAGTERLFDRHTDQIAARQDRLSPQFRVIFEHYTEEKRANEEERIKRQERDAKFMKDLMTAQAEEAREGDVA